METIDEKLVSLLLVKELTIKELEDYISLLQTQLQQMQVAYNKLYKLHYLKKVKKVKQRVRIGYKK